MADQHATGGNNSRLAFGGAASGTFGLQHAFVRPQKLQECRWFIFELVVQGGNARVGRFSHGEVLFCDTTLHCALGTASWGPAWVRGRGQTILTGVTLPVIQ